MSTPRPALRVLGLHTSGAFWLDAVGTLGAGFGALRWIDPLDGPELGAALQSALHALGVERTLDGRAVSTWWIVPRSAMGSRPTGSSADLMIAAAVLTRWMQGRLKVELGTPGSDPVPRRPLWLLSGSGSFGLDLESGITDPEVRPVEGLADKVGQLAKLLETVAVERLLMLVAPSQRDELERALTERGIRERVSVAAISGPRDLLETLRGFAGESPPLWRPDGWPEPAADAGRLLDAAHNLACSLRGGFLGVEHLVAALLQPGLGGGPAAGRLRDLSQRGGVDPWLNAGDAPTDGEPTLTPRLASWAAHLDDGFDIETLARVICADPDHHLHALAGQDLGAADHPTADPWATVSAAAWAGSWSADVRAVQVLRGPEDGRVLRLRRGETLGRWAPTDGPQQALYTTSNLQDPALSRRALTWEEDGHVRLARPARHVRGGATVLAPPGELALQPGDILQLSPGTWLRALDRESALVRPIWPHAARAPNGAML